MGRACSTIREIRYAEEFYSENLMGIDYHLDLHQDERMGR
jgi:hypothetical protein